MSVTTLSGYNSAPQIVNPGNTLVVTGTVADGGLINAVAVSGSLDNQGLIFSNNSFGAAVYWQAGATITNSGTIAKYGPNGASLYGTGQAYLSNSGVIIGDTFVKLQSTGTYSSQIINRGIVYGNIGIANYNAGHQFVSGSYASDTGTIVNYGTILGDTGNFAVGVDGTGNDITLGGFVSVSGPEAVLMSGGTNELTLLHGVTLVGAVLCATGSDTTVTLSGSVGAAPDAVTLQTFEGSNAAIAVAIDDSAPWVLNIAGTVIPGITGFGAADTLVLQGASVTAAAEVPGVGVLLESSSGPAFLSLPNTYGSAAAFYVHTASSGTTITVVPAAFGNGNVPQLPVYQSGTVLMGTSGSTGYLLQNGRAGGTALTVGAGQGVGIAPGAALIGGNGGTGGAGLRPPTIASYDYPPPLPNTVFIPGGAGGNGGAGLYLNGGVVLNAGTIAGGNGGAPGYLAVQTQASGGAGVTLQSGILINAGTISGGNGAAAVSFTGVGTLEEAPGAVLNGAIAGLTAGDLIILDSFAATSESFVSGTGLILSNATASETIDITGSFSTADFAIQTQAGNTLIDLAAPCFCTGTRIATARGNVPVESLKIGDMVKTATQGFQPIRWIGRRAYDGRFIAGNHLALPVTIRRHALGHNVPSRDLHVSPGHAICEGGVLVHSWRLVNGVSITQAEAVKRVEYFHIELDRHTVIFAHNTPVESFLDNGCRAQFQNAASAPTAAPQKPCLPLIEDGYYLARLKARIDARAGITRPAAPGPLRGNLDHAGLLLCGWAQDEAAPETPVELDLLCGSVPVMRFLANKFCADLRAAGLGSGCHAFELTMPPLTGLLTLRRVSDGAILGSADAGRDRRSA
jgi:hypothetical protein